MHIMVHCKSSGSYHLLETTLIDRDGFLSIYRVSPSQSFLRTSIINSVSSKYGCSDTLLVQQLSFRSLENCGISTRLETTKYRRLVTGFRDVPAVLEHSRAYRLSKLS